MAFYVYKFLDKRNNVLYVGRTDNLERRMTEHFGGNGHLPKSYYTLVCSVEFLTFDYRNDMKMKELHYISKYDPVYNTKDKGGSALLFDDSGDEWSVYALDVKREMLSKQELVELPKVVSYTKWEERIKYLESKYSQQSIHQGCIDLALPTTSQLTFELGISKGSIQTLRKKLVSMGYKDMGCLFFTKGLSN